MSGFHRDIKGDQNHIIHFREYANAAARTGDATLDASHLRKVALQVDTNTFWVLLDASPVTWKELAPEPPPPETPVHGKIEMFWGTISAAGRPIDIKTGQPDLRYGCCDGRSYLAPDGRNVATPNMRDRFVVGAGGAYGKGATGGASTITLSAAQMPSHSHSISGSDGSYTIAPYYPAQTTRGNYVGLSGMGGAGSSHAHENRPPYIGVYYIMYL